MRRGDHLSLCGLLLGVALLSGPLLTPTVASAIGEGGNGLEDYDLGTKDQDNAPPSGTGRKYDGALIDDVLNSDYFEDDDDVDDDKEDAGNDAPAAPVGVTPSVLLEAEEEEVSTQKNRICAGCPYEVSPEDGKIQELASFAFAKHFSSFEKEEQGQRMVRVVNAMTQVVAGQKYILDLEVGVTNCTKAQHDQGEKCELDPSVDTFICNFEVIEQSWVKRKEVIRSACKREGPTPGAVLVEEIEDDTEDSDEVTEGSSRRRKRDLNDNGKKTMGKKVLGGSRDAEESNEKLMEIATFAVQELDKSDADDEARLVIEVLDSKKQTVSGWLYSLKIRVAHTTCKEGDEVTMEKCGDKIVPPYRVCDVKVLQQPWQEVSKRVTESQCYPEKAFYSKDKSKMGKKMKFEKKYRNKEMENDVNSDKRLLGGFQDIDVKAEELTALMDFVVDTIDQQSNALHAQKLVKIVEAQRQVVAGLKTKVVLELGYTSCRKHPKLDKANCDIDDKREHQFCNVTVYEQPWLKQRQITHSKCGPKESMFQERKKRSLSHFHIDWNEFNEKIHEDFRNFMEKHGKTYETDEEYNYRLSIFKDNMNKVKVLEVNEGGDAKYGATFFADLTEEEFSKHYLGLRPDLKQGPRKGMKKAKVPYVANLPDSFDWRDYKAVTPVKNQGMCGSCWAFSVTGNIEGLYAKKYNKLLSFSEQELVDCDTLDEGCNGGLPENAYKALEKLGGLETEIAYPYDGHNSKCSFDSSKAAAKVKGFVELPKNETEMAMWLIKNGPISIGINANAMQFYMGGVSHPWKFLCSKKNLDHGVLIVGYGVHTYPLFNRTLPYWTVKNSWGPSWGEQGYYRVYRGENTCGLAEMASSAVVE